KDQEKPSTSSPQPSSKHPAPHWSPSPNPTTSSSPSQPNPPEAVPAWCWIHSTPPPDSHNWCGTRSPAASTQPWRNAAPKPSAPAPSPKPAAPTIQQASSTQAKQPKSSSATS